MKLFKKTSYISGVNFGSLKKFLIFWDMELTAVKHRETLCKTKIHHKDITL